MSLLVSNIPGKMLTKVPSLLRAAPRVHQISRMGHGYPAHFKPMRQVFEETKSHMNFQPVPSGSWQEGYSKQNAKWNQLLALSILSVIVTAGVIWKTDTVYLHSPPPSMYNNIKKKE